MPDPVTDPVKDPVVDPVKDPVVDPVVPDPSVLDKSGQPVIDKDKSVLDGAGAAEKAAQDAENKRLIDADPATLTPEDVTKRDVAVKAKADADAAALATEKAKGVPEKYNLAAPDGTEWDPAKMETVTAEFKKQGLTQVQAQEMVNLFVSQQKLAVADSEAKFKKFLDDSAKETMDALGVNAKTELAYVAKVKTLFSPETLAILNSSGMGNVKSFILDLAKIGRLFSEDNLADSGKGSGAGTDIAGKLYPSMNK